MKIMRQASAWVALMVGIAFTGFAFAYDHYNLQMNYIELTPHGYYTVRVEPSRYHAPLHLYVKSRDYNKLARSAYSNHDHKVLVYSMVNRGKSFRDDYMYKVRVNSSAGKFDALVTQRTLHQYGNYGYRNQHSRPVTGYIVMY